MNKNLDRRIHPIAEADGLSPKKLVNNHEYRRHHSRVLGMAVLAF